AGLVEARVRAGEAIDSTLVATLGHLEQHAVRPHRVAAAARSLALLEPTGYRPHLDRAIAMLSRPCDAFARGRTRLVCGELLQREGRRSDARTQLQLALAEFEALGAPLWAERVRRELRASGMPLARRTPGAAERLSPAELQVATEVARGKSNREVAAALF